MEKKLIPDNIMKKKAVVYCINVLTIMLGTFFMGIAFSVFLSPNKISPTGFSGIASLICNFASSKGVYINPSLLYLGMNAVLFAIAFKSMGKEFIILSVTGVAAYSLSMFLCGYIHINVGNDLLLCAVYGGLFMGLGSGLVLRSGGSTGGGDTIACMLKNRNSRITTGQILIIVDTIIILGSCLVYGITYGMYALVTCFIMGNVCDVVINGVKAARAYYIITDKADNMSHAIIDNIKRGVTCMDVVGMYQNTNHKMIMCIVTRSQVVALKRVVKSYDPTAFMYSVNVTEALGRGFDPLDKKATLKSKNDVKPTTLEDTVITSKPATDVVVDNNSVVMEVNNNTNLTNENSINLNDNIDTHQPADHKTVVAESTTISQPQSKRKKQSKSNKSDKND